MKNLEITPSNIIIGLNVIKTNPFIDQRGSFSRLFCEIELDEIIGERNIVQINFSKTKLIGSIRGLHFQKSPYKEMKFIRCLKGRVWDIAVDLRKDSKSFLKWHAEELTSENSKMIAIPEGCAHGFQVLEEESELIYLHTAPYNILAEDGVRYNDPIFNIKWPLEVTNISDKDKNFNLLKQLI